MTLDFELSDPLKKILAKLAVKDRKLALSLQKKIAQITELTLEEVSHFKNLKAPKSRFKRVHIGSFVLVFYLEGETIYFEDFNHHDNIYKK